MQPVNEQGKKLIETRGTSAFDIETDALGINKSRPGGPVSINTIGPFEIAILGNNNGEIIELLHEESSLDAHSVAGSALTVTPVSTSDLIPGNRQSQFQMAKKIYNHFQNDNSVLFSFNGIGFDAIVLRHFFYRNLFNPYLFSYDDRLHIDLLNVAFCARDLSNKINFKLNQKGRKSLKQLDIATANGFDPGTAHTACDDALTLYKLANLFEEEIPEIFYTAIVCGNKRRVLDRLQNEEFFCYSNPWNTKALAFFARNQFKGMENEGYFFNLAADPQKYLNASADDIIKLINTPRSPIIKVGLNKNPILLSGLRFSEKIGINPDEANRRAGIIRSNEEFIRNFHQALHKRGNPYTNEFIEYPEMAIYQGFPSREDGILAAEFSHASYTERMQIMLHLKDFRLKKFAQRLLAIEHPDQCSRSISKKYKRFTKMRLLRDNHLTPNLTITGALDQIDASIAQGFDNQERIFEINNYLENLRKEAELL